MDWLLTNPQIQSTFSSLGTIQDETYVVNADALAVLDEINCKLSCEDQTLRTYRRAIGFSQKVKFDLIPLLINARDPDIIDATIRILVNLTVPVECLFSVDVMYRTEMGRHTIFEINNLLLKSKEAFTDSKCTKAVIDHMKSILESDTKLSQQQCDSINNCLLLFRNILHIPEHNNGMMLQTHHNIGNNNNNNYTSMQNTIIWNLFIQSIDKLLIYLMTCSQRSHWGVTMVQLIALMYKDQHVSTLQKLLSVWFEASLSESSEDNESNTSPPKQGSGDSSPMLTSDPTSDSSDNGGSSKQENAEDRRQANLNKETEQTLQQVSRKGHEYQSAILRVSAKQQQEYSNQQCNNQLMGPPKHPIHQNITSVTTNNISNNSCAGSGVSGSINGNGHGTNDITKDGNRSPPLREVKQQQTAQTNYSSPSRKQRTKSPHSGVGQINSGKFCGQKRECPSSQSELSDCGYGTQVENQESISTSSNEEDGPQQKPIHQKPPCNQKQRKTRTAVTMQDKKEWRRKKLVKRSKSNLINMKGLVQHIPNDEDISNILKEFTVDFLLKGYGYLVQELHAQLLSDLKIQMDTSHFFWLVTYFLKFAAQLELDLEHISSVLSFDVVSFLTYEGVSLCEQLELTSRQEGSDLKPYLRRMHLVVTAIREFLQALETYKKITHLSKEDRQHLHMLQVQITSAEDLRCLFILLIRTYNPTLHSKQYLQDLVVTNHILLLLLDGTSKVHHANVNIKMLDHIAQFATVEVMHHYGLLLEDFNENGEFVNDCIFTMMHHIGGDLGQITTLFQPIILKTYSRIWEAEYELCDDWSDLIEYVIHKFMNTPQKSPLTLPSPTSLTEITKELNMEHSNCAWSQEEMDTLYWYYVQSKKSKDTIGNIIKLFRDNGNKEKSRLSIIQQLLQQDIITLVEYDDLMKFEDAEYQRKNTKTSTLSVGTAESGIEIKDTVVCKSSDDIQVLKDRLLREHKGKMLTWLQKVLIECCFVKMNISAGKLYCKDIITEDEIQIMEPIPHHCILRKKSIPVVPWNSDQSSIMLYQPFVLLLHKLGFHLPADSGKVYLRIPEFWTADILYNIAKKLGPIEKCKPVLTKFDINLLGGDGNAQTNTTKSPPLRITEECTSEVFAVPKIKHANSIIRFTPDPLSTPSVPSWLQLVMKSKYPERAPEKPSSSSSLSIIPTSPKQTNQTLLSDGDSIIKATTVTTTVNDCGNSSNNDQLQDDDIIQLGACNTLENNYSALVASVCENEMFNCETESVASDLTRMYVSDEDDKS